MRFSFDWKVLISADLQIIYGELKIVHQYEMAGNIFRETWEQKTNILFHTLQYRDYRQNREANKKYCVSTAVVGLNTKEIKTQPDRISSF